MKYVYTHAHTHTRYISGGWVWYIDREFRVHFGDNCTQLANERAITYILYIYVCIVCLVFRVIGWKIRLIIVYLSKEPHRMWSASIRRQGLEIQLRREELLRLQLETEREWKQTVLLHPWPNGATQRTKWTARPAPRLQWALAPPPPLPDRTRMSLAETWMHLSNMLFQLTFTWFRATTLAQFNYSPEPQNPLLAFRLFSLI